MKHSNLGIMDASVKGIHRQRYIPDGLSEVSDLEDDDEGGFMINCLDDEEDVDDFELPIRATPVRYNNFSALNEDWKSSENANSSSSISKRVRFGNDDSRTGSRSKIVRRKRDVEELLQYANRVNEYLTLNLDEIDTFRSELMANDSMPYKTIGSETTLATTTTTCSRSASNFELSEAETEEEKLHLDNSTSGVSSDSDRGWEKTPLIQEEDTGDKVKIPSFSEILQRVRKASEREQENEKKASNNVNGPLINTYETMGISQAIEVFQDTIHCILQMFQEQNPEHKANPGDCDFNQFFMKGVPTLSYQDFIARIQSKCIYNPAIFLASAFLLQTLCLMRDDTNGKLCLKRPLQGTQIHRLVIACIRVVTKIMEDHIHPHQYFCKVCGISKTLLSRLEMSLVACLKDEQFMVTGERLASASKVKDELMDSISNRSST